ncbi:hypothetical protein [Hymenobacter lapidiphilus]|uniref:Uncharacterized protein n=1 Tax=Hymenobacter lapidiphilus TaxID=2608003 RepID=A0A7Y7U5I6_9BACT|nr:hypothetical protein [Hymenobacter lapidiphilus]NVO31347.1 hypothetical protein [Hymenobacter lapidiphilus]
MNDIVKVLQDFLYEIQNQSTNFDVLPLMWNKTRLYLDKFSDGKNSKQLESIPQIVDDYIDLNKAYNSLGAIIETLIEEIKIGSEYKVLSQDQYKELKKARNSLSHLLEDIINLLQKLSRKRNQIFN